MHAAARTLSLVMRKLIKKGATRSLQGTCDDPLARLSLLLNAVRLFSALHRFAEAPCASQTG